MSENREPPSNRPLPQWLRALAVSGLWLVLLVGLLRFGARYLPAFLARQLTVESYSILAQLVAMLLGSTLCVLVLEAPRHLLGLHKAGLHGVLVATLLGPATYVVICYAAVGLALPTLREELARGGVELVRSQGGAIVNAMTRPSVVIPLVWAVVVSPVGEELLFRGALWGALHGLLERVSSNPQSRNLETDLPLERSLVLEAWGWAVRSGSVATLLTALVFAALHADLHGSQGIVRVVSAGGLALACGVARQSTGALAAPIALHVFLNMLTLANARHWLDTEMFPKFYTVPTLVTLAAALGLVIAVVVLVHERSRRVT